MVICNGFFYSDIQSDGDNFCGDVVLDSVKLTHIPTGIRVNGTAIKIDNFFLRLSIPLLTSSSVSMGKPWAELRPR